MSADEHALAALPEGPVAHRGRPRPDGAVDIAADEAPVCEVFEHAEPDLPQPLALHCEPLLVLAGKQVRLEQLLGDLAHWRGGAQLFGGGQQAVPVHGQRRPETEAAAGPDVHQVGSELA